MKNLKPDLKQLFNPTIIFVLLSIVFLFIQCQSPYLNEDLTADKQIPVVNGVLNNLNGLQYFELYYAKPYSDRVTKKISGARVAIVDDNQQQYLLTEVSSGNYINETKWTPQIGNSYSIEVLLPDGNLLKSEPATMPDTIGIDNIFYDFNIKTTLVKSQDGSYNEISQQGIFVNLRMNKPQLNNTFFRTKCDYYVHSQRWGQTIRSLKVEGKIYDYNYEIRYDTLYNILEGVSNTDFPTIGMLNPSTNYAPTDLTIETVFLPADQECLNFTAYTKNTFIEWIFPVDLITTTSVTYNYYLDAQQQLEAGQRIYDPIPQQIIGNVYSETDPYTPVLGLFDVNSVSRRYYAVYVFESLGYRSYQGRFYSDTVFRGGIYPAYGAVDTVFIDSTLHENF